MAVKFTTGQIVLLTDTRHGRTLRFVVEEKNRGTNYLLARPSNPYARLHVAQNGKVSYSESQPSSGSFFVLVHAGAAAGDYRLQSATLSPTVCVGVQPDGSLRAHPLDLVVDGSRVDADAAQQSSLCFRIGGGGNGGSGVVAGVSPRPVALQPWEVRRFVAEGFVVLRGCVRRDVLRRCDRVLTRAWAVPGSVVAGGSQGDGVGCDGRCCWLRCDLHWHCEFDTGHGRAFVTQQSGQSDGAIYFGIWRCTNDCPSGCWIYGAIIRIISWSVMGHCGCHGARNGRVGHAAQNRKSKLEKAN